MKTTKKVLFICKKRIDSYGISFGLVNSAKFIANQFDKANENKKGYDNNHHGAPAFASSRCDVECKVVMVVDANGIDKEIALYKPTHVVIHALWVTPHKLEELVKKWNKVYWIIRVHSKIPFLANEGIAFNWLCKYKEIMRVYSNLIVSGNNEPFNDDLEETMGLNTVYLPNIYCPDIYDDEAPIKSIWKREDVIDIGCFGALRPMKNHMNQAVAAVKFAKKIGKIVNFHVNADRIEQNGEQVIKNLRSYFGCIPDHQLVEHAWMSHKDFIGLVKQMDMGMQVSFSESFNIVSADFVWNDIPMVMGKDIDWSPAIFAADPNSTDDMVCKMKWAWYGRWGLQRLSKNALERYNEDAFRIWKKFICSTEA